jgi:plastocyanin
MNVVSIDNFSFTPMELTISAGTPVTWINNDDVPHTVVSVDHKFKSQALDTDEKLSFTFQDPCTYEYFCSV